MNKKENELEKEKFKSLEHLRKQENTKRISIEEYNSELDEAIEEAKRIKQESSSDSYRICCSAET